MHIYTNFLRYEESDNTPQKKTKKKHPRQLLMWAGICQTLWSSAMLLHRLWRLLVVFFLLSVVFPPTFKNTMIFQASRLQEAYKSETLSVCLLFSKYTHFFCVCNLLEKQRNTLDKRIRIQASPKIKTR